VTHDELIASFTGQIDQTLNRLIPAGTSCALLDFPNHSNIGDSALWLGERAYLRRINARLVHTSDRLSLIDSRLVESLGKDGLILLHGGGNLGDLWLTHQRLRERVIVAFPHHRIIQLPQTIHFREKSNLAQARRIFNAHPDLTLLVRDKRSLEFARNEFRAASLLCPDMVFALGPLRRPRRPTKKLVWLARRDIPPHPSEVMKLATDGVRIVDWVIEKSSNPRSISTARQWFRSWSVRRLASSRLTSRSLPHLFDLLAARRLRTGCLLLSQGQVVVTNRLHGHLLCLLLRIPHVIVDNGYGKISAYYETWTKSAELARQADSWTEAFALARALADG